MSEKINRYLKNRWIAIVGLVLFIGFMWFFSVSKTIGIYKQNQKLSKVLATTDGELGSIHYLSGTLKKLEEELNFNRDKEVDFESDFFKTLGNLCTENNIQIKGISAPRNGDLGSHKSEIFEIQLTGNFKEMLRVVRGLEKDLYYGNLLSLTFESKTDRKTKAKYLEVTLHIQIIFLNDMVTDEYLILER